MRVSGKASWKGHEHGPGHGWACAGLAGILIRRAVSTECQHSGYTIVTPKSARTPMKQPSPRPPGAYSVVGKMDINRILTKQCTVFGGRAFY